MVLHKEKVSRKTVSQSITFGWFVWVDLLLFWITERIIKGKVQWRLRESKGSTVVPWWTGHRMPQTMLPSLLPTFCDSWHPAKSTLSVKGRLQSLVVTGPKDHRSCALILQPSEIKRQYETEDELLPTEGTAPWRRQLWIALHTQ